jgi:hypothetical protein
MNPSPFGELPGALLPKHRHHRFHDPISCQLVRVRVGSTRHHNNAQLSEAGSVL